MNFMVFTVNAVYYFLYFVIISRMFLTFTSIHRGGFYDFIIKTSEVVISPFRKITGRNGLIDFSPLLALLAIMLFRNIILAMLLYLPLGNIVGFAAAVFIAFIDLADLLLGFYLALVIIYYFLKIQIKKIIRSNTPMFGGFSPDRLLFMIGRWCTPVTTHLNYLLPDRMKKYVEIILILIIIIVKLLLKYGIAYLRTYIF